MTKTHRSSANAHLRVRVLPEQRTDLKTLARKRHISVSQLLRSAIARELADDDAGSSSLPDESAIREMAILIAVELVLKLQEASIPGGATLSRRLLEDAARAAVARLESVEAAIKDAQR
jgi:hypothetical protein